MIARAGVTMQREYRGRTAVSWFFYRARHLPLMIDAVLVAAAEQTFSLNALVYDVQIFPDCRNLGIGIMSSYNDWIRRVTVRSKAFSFED